MCREYYSTNERPTQEGRRVQGVDLYKYSDDCCNDFVSGILRPRRPRYLPFRTYREFEEDSDPISTLLGAFSGLEEGEGVLSRLILRPAPPGWADAFQASSAREAMKFQTIEGLSFMGLGIVSFVYFSFCMLLSLLLGLRRNFGGLFALFLFSVPFLGLLFFLLRRFFILLSANPQVIRRKVSLPGFYAELRIFAFGERKEDLLERVQGAYSLFNISEGNSFIFERRHFSPLDNTIARGLRGLILNTAEIAALWHLPVGLGSDMMAKELYRSFLPVPSSVETGVLIGHSVKEGREIPVRLSIDALDRNVFLFAKTQYGKSNVMLHIANFLLRKKRSIVAVDPHGDFVRDLLSLVPRERIEDVIYIDLADRFRAVGLNLLDMSLDIRRDKLVADLVKIGKTIWQDAWGPRMEDALSYACSILCDANSQMVTDGEEEKQFTVLAIPLLLSLKRFREAVVVNYVDDLALLNWAFITFGNLPRRMKEEVIYPVQTKIQHFSRSRTAKAVVGQGRSTINLRKEISDGKIILLNTAVGEVGEDIGGLLGACIINLLEIVIREQMSLPREKRVKVTVFIDEFQAIPGVDFVRLLGELQKMGANFIIASQSLSRMDRIDPFMKGGIFSNIDTFFCFQTSGEDARYLKDELDGIVEERDLTNLPRFHGYLKTIEGERRLPLMLVRTLPPLKGDPKVKEEIISRAELYTRPIEEVEEEIKKKMKEWTEIDYNVLEQHRKLQRLLKLRGRIPATRSTLGQELERKGKGRRKGRTH
jgi:hypothetical protein